MALRAEDDDVHQVLLHEVAHALAGRSGGHGPRWKAVAKELGYEGGRTFDGDIAAELAPWVGTCPAGHEVRRHRRPTKPMSCGRCSRRFDPAHLLRWVRR
jgi:predicted SprT family Zn-dependent metalloprotease